MDKIEVAANCTSGRHGQMLATIAAFATLARGVDFDVVVYGSTPAGIAAATAAGHLGMKVVLVEVHIRSVVSTLALTTTNPLH